MTSCKCLNTMTFGREVVINTPGNVTKMAEVIYAAGVKPEFEIFDSGDMALALDLFAGGVLKTPGMFSFVLGVKYGMPASPESMLYLRNMLPPGSAWTGFGIGRAAFPMVAQAERCPGIAQGARAEINGVLEASYRTYTKSHISGNSANGSSDNQDFRIHSLGKIPQFCHTHDHGQARIISPS